jgi:Putative prokaryotic signal transducing protein
MLSRCNVLSTGLQGGAISGQYFRCPRSRPIFGLSWLWPSSEGKRRVIRHSSKALDLIRIVDDAHAANDPAMRIVAAYSTPTEAHLLVSRLASAGIEAQVRDEYTITFNWLISNAIGGAKVEVPDDDFESAREIVTMSPPEEALLRCPHCGSSETRVRVLNAFGAICMMLKLPIPMTRAVVDCRSCGKTHDAPIGGRV